MPRDDLAGVKHLSQSQVNKLRQCPAQWEWQYIKGFWGPSTPNLIIGGVYHSAIEGEFHFKLENGIDMDLELVEDLVQAEWKKYKKGNIMDWQGASEVQLLDQCYNLAYHYISTTAVNIMPAQVEQEYVVPIEGTGYVFVLRLDLMDNKGIVYDHKTAKNMMHYGQAEVHRSPQATATAFALNKGIVYHNHVILKSRTPRVEVIKTFRTLADVQWYKSILPKYVRMIESGSFPPNDEGWWCDPLYCSVYEKCRPGLHKIAYSKDKNAFDDAPY